MLALSLAASPKPKPPDRFPPPMIRPPTIALTRHTFVIPDPEVVLIPSIGIVVGSRATLVVDTGMGRRNAQTVLREVSRISTNARLYLTATGYEAEHISGISAFPASTTFVVSQALQQDLDQLGSRAIASAARLTPIIGDLLKGAALRRGDIVFEREHVLDLGGVRVRLLRIGPAHARGDTVAIVEGKGVVFAGDVVLNRRFLSFTDRSTREAWLRALDALEALRPRTIVTGHGAFGDASIIGRQRAMLQEIWSRVRELKGQGWSLGRTSRLVDDEFQEKYPDWKATFPNELSPMVKSLYSE